MTCENSGGRTFQTNAKALRQDQAQQTQETGRIPISLEDDEQWRVLRNEFREVDRNQIKEVLVGP